MSNADNETFQEVVEILNKNNINYWLCHGTLLGVIRENRLLPWDHDIDFAFWADEYSKSDILKLFSDCKYQQISIPAEMNNLHFLVGNNKRVDINFYTRNEKSAFTEWIAPGGVPLRAYYFIVDFLTSDFDIKRFSLSSNFFAQSLKIILMIPLMVLKLLLPKSWGKSLHKDVHRRLRYTGYSYPVNLMTFKKINFLEVATFVPINAEKCLELTYGKDWKTPKQDYVWYKEAENLLEQE
jgi:phosphorylcholine metabolism protein LicD